MLFTRKTIRHTIAVKSASFLQNKTHSILFSNYYWLVVFDICKSHEILHSLRARTYRHEAVRKLLDQLVGEVSLMDDHPAVVVLRSRHNLNARHSHRDQPAFVGKEHSETPPGEDQNRFAKLTVRTYV